MSEKTVLLPALSVRFEDFEARILALGYARSGSQLRLHERPYAVTWTLGPQAVTWIEDHVRGVCDVYSQGPAKVLAVDGVETVPREAVLAGVKGG